MNYETLILKRLLGDTPKEKYQNLLELEKLVDSVCYPRRGTEEENMPLGEFANRFHKFSQQHRDEEI